MTFIASVVSKEGVAIIADSLVTTSRPIINWEDFNRLISQKKSDGTEDISFSAEEITDLFQFKESHTKNYEDKLFEIDKCTVLTTTGIAEINDRKMSKVVHDFIATKRDWLELTIEEKVVLFKDFMTKEVKSHIAKYNYVNPLKFILTHYSINDEITTIYTLEIPEANSTSLQNPAYIYVYDMLEPEWKKVVCSGQNKISDKILFGTLLHTIPQVLPKIITKLCKDHSFDQNKISQEYLDTFLTPGDEFSDTVLGDMEILNLSPLSLQQAVDLAWLLMRIETDFQKYTKTIPTVGGVVKLATIDKHGFKFISGAEIQLPSIF